MEIATSCPLLISIPEVAIVHHNRHKPLHEAVRSDPVQIGHCAAVSEVEAIQWDGCALVVLPTVSKGPVCRQGSGKGALAEVGWATEQESKRQVVLAFRGELLQCDLDIVEWQLHRLLEIHEARWEAGVCLPELLVIQPLERGVGLAAVLVVLPQPSNSLLHTGLALHRLHLSKIKCVSERESTTTTQESL